ncbi:polysaccharide biosynthesis protein [Aerococcaceae bacterium INB8]|uniref:Polysaccharide biosynthesis protein n=1 Tax=Ruoffia halotolerans TaxID=2748684 RepID=A0A839A6X6_9LACT|nr:polysaccharide biosynthesis protein [Ruoffia halotolerans]
MNNIQKTIVWLLADFICLCIGSASAYIFYWNMISPRLKGYFLFTIVAFVIYIIVSRVFKLNMRINRYSGIRDLFSLFMAFVLSGSLSGLITIFFDFMIALRFMVLAGIVAGIIGIGLRVLWQNIYLLKDQSRRTQTEDIKQIIVIGAGDGGSLFVENHIRNPQDTQVVAILDENPKKQGKSISGIKVAGDLSQLEAIEKDYDIDRAIIAIPSLTPEDYERIITELNKYDIKPYKMPKVEDVITGVYQRNHGPKKVDIGDLLGRKEIQLDESHLRKEIEGKTIAITGAGGSIGSEITRQISRFNPKRVLLIGHGENSIYLIYQELQQLDTMTEFVPVIADVQDYERIYELFKEEEVDIVYHAAAHKHVPLMEWNPEEALKNNILGSYNVAKAVDQAKVGKMVMISTDKAVRPPNVMGASKRVAELIVTGMNKQSDSIFCAVRFGNVLGSRGSVIPLFEKQIAAGGPVTVTDFRMTRYFMTIPEASRLVVFAGAHADGGEVFILNMGEPVKIVDLARKLILLSGHTESEIPIVEAGIRPGEKLYEELLTSGELVEEQIDENIFIGKVVDKPLSETVEFVESLNDLHPRKLKQAIIDFANHSAE